MNKEFIPYEQALELKELGFREKCAAFYQEDGKFIFGGYYQCGDIPMLFADAPLYQQAFRWFREKYNLQSHIEYNKGFYEWWILLDVVGYDTYEEAELACLIKLIEISKKK